MDKCPKENIIQTYKAKTKYIDVYPQDSSGTIDGVDFYDYYLYAKKYPVNPDADLDISIGATSVSGGKVRFNLYPPTTNLAAGDYVYQVKAVNPYKEAIIASDTFKIFESLETDYTVEGVTINPSVKIFTVHDLSINASVLCDPIWTSTSPSWLTLSPDNDVGDSSIVVTAYNPSLTNYTGQIVVTNIYGVSDTMDVSFYYSAFVFTPSAWTFTPDTSITVDVSTSAINDWNIPYIPSWLTIDVSYGTGPGSFILEASIVTNKTPEDVSALSTYSYETAMDVSFYYSTTLTVDRADPYPFNLDNSFMVLSIVSSILNIFPSTSSHLLPLLPYNFIITFNLGIKTSMSFPSTLFSSYFFANYG